MTQVAFFRPPDETDRPGPAAGYATRDVAALLGLSTAKIRSLVRDGLLSPTQGPRGDYRFSFQDLILLRTAKGLLGADVPPRRIRLALQKLKEQLPEGRPLTGVRITAQGHHVVVRDGQEVWIPESGQILLDFQVSDLEREASSFVRHAEKKKPQAEPVTAASWFERGCDLEAEDDLDAATAAYRRALELDPNLPDAHLNLGRLVHETGDLAAAETHYRAALPARPEDPTAAFNLGVVLQDLGRLEDAAAAYQQAIARDERYADAHYNLAGIYETLGQAQEAFRHLRTYKALTEG